MLSPAPSVTRPVASVRLRQAGPQGKQISIDTPFRLTVNHGELDLEGLFAAAQAFDFYEVNGVAGENAGKARRPLIVDVLESTPTATTLQVTPTCLMTYAEIAKEMKQMVDGIAERHLPGGATGVRVQWLASKLGMASDLRGRLHNVR
jgi:hypothetical protein